ncbi:hypothetical protein K474DRAFT_1703787 [Panus rudis PR-1116 ss-1]|nr:hypothetical protein K474DRAFT_1703787 [Panus rudis PR-1116 ss-1]
MKGPFDDSPSASPPTSASEAWQELANRLARRDERMVEGWREDTDNLLIFAGLFSAVLTTFLVDSYRQLRPDPGDTTNLLLLQISAQLNGLSQNGTPVSSTIPAATADLVAPAVEGVYIHVNTLWFASLVFSLSAAAIALVVRQWLREYLRYHESDPHDIALTRHHRFQALHRWGVPSIITMLPVILQTSLALFVVGLAILLFNLNTMVGLIMAPLIGITLMLLVLTSVVPTISADCSYKSPQAELVYSAFRLMSRIPATWTKVLISVILPVLEMPKWRNHTGKLRNALFDVELVAKNLVRKSWNKHCTDVVQSRKDVLDREVLLHVHKTSNDNRVLTELIPACITEVDPSILPSLLDDLVTMKPETVQRDPVKLIPVMVASASRALDFEAGTTASTASYTIMEHPQIPGEQATAFHEVILGPLAQEYYREDGLEKRAVASLLIRSFHYLSVEAPQVLENAEPLGELINTNKSAPLSFVAIVSHAICRILSDGECHRDEMSMSNVAMCCKMVSNLSPEEYERIKPGVQRLLNLCDDTYRLHLPNRSPMYTVREVESVHALLLALVQLARRVSEPGIHYASLMTTLFKYVRDVGKGEDTYDEADVLQSAERWLRGHNPSSLICAIPDASAVALPSMYRECVVPAHVVIPIGGSAVTVLGRCGRKGSSDSTVVGDEDLDEVGKEKDG